jgi:SAM-dependent methyltransferase
LTARSSSTHYYAGKVELLTRIFGDAVRVTSDGIQVGNAFYPVLNDVIVTLPPERSPVGIGGRGITPHGEFARDVQTSFGAQWQEFSEVTLEHRREFEQYFDLIELDALSEVVVADLGCGSGRYAACVAPHAGAVVLADFSEAIFVARENLRDVDHAVFIMADLLDLPFGDDAFDFAYSLGVLHHLPVPALEALKQMRRFSPRLLVYLYYSLDNRPAYFRAVLGIADGLRRRLVAMRSVRGQRAAIWLITVLVYWPLSRLGSVLRPLGLDKRIPLAEFYQGKPIRRLRQDAHDRFLTSIEQRVSRTEIMGLADAHWRVTVSERLPYWHFLYASGCFSSSTTLTEAREQV